MPRTENGGETGGSRLQHRVQTGVVEAASDVGHLPHRVEVGQDTHPIEWCVSLGLGGRGQFPGRDEDSWGFGYFYNRVQEPRPVVSIFTDDQSQGIEAFYKAVFTPAVDLSVDAQWLESAISNVDDAFLLGLRLNVAF